VVVNRSEDQANLNKLDSKIGKLDGEVCQVKDALKENNDQLKRQQRENAELINHGGNKEKLEAESQFVQLCLEIKALKSRILENVPLSPFAPAIVDNINQCNQVCSRARARV
jgi:septal ring factor EnvC (AmiA/AmiB activator)